jgi:hypothetical protein
MFLQNYTLMTSLLVATMTPDLQKHYEHVDDYTMIHELRGMFDKKSKG